MIFQIKKKIRDSERPSKRFRYLLPDEERRFTCVAGVANGICSLQISYLLSPDAEEATYTTG